MEWKYFNNFERGPQRSIPVKFSEVLLSALGGDVVEGKLLSDNIIL